MKRCEDVLTSFQWGIIHWQMNHRWDHARRFQFISLFLHNMKQILHQNTSVVILGGEWRVPVCFRINSSDLRPQKLRSIMFCHSCISLILGFDSLYIGPWCVECVFVYIFVGGVGKLVLLQKYEDCFILWFILARLEYNFPPNKWLLSAL